ncbi:cytochrome P450 [Rhodococcus pyridinivorans]|uniref:cytochrome P450 n=1 Tax=Rhodococcus pyridinivorans TaxID=103816 RepID=UPI00200AE1DB|nr:cytochrome P450 [Rhodococcus pyridinivorans]UPW03386.1 cytochrome P450 [Rhodococcus pyridinivorans]
MIDFIPAISAPLPLEVIAALLGAPAEDVGKLYGWSNRMIGWDDPEYGTTREDDELAAAEIFLYANEIAARRHRLEAGVSRRERRHALRDGVRRVLRPARHRGQRDDAQRDLGRDAGRRRSPEQWRRLQNDPGLIDSAVEEILRWVTPVVGFRRTPTCPASIGDQQVERGDNVIVYYPSANRDEEVFDDAHVFDIGREHDPHVAFGGTGVHFCLGGTSGAVRTADHVRDPHCPYRRGRTGRRTAAVAIELHQRHQVHARPYPALRS